MFQKFNLNINRHVSDDIHDIISSKNTEEQKSTNS